MICDFTSGLVLQVLLVHQSRYTDLSLSKDGRQPFSEDSLLACLTLFSHVLSLIKAHGTCPGVCGHFDSSDHSLCYLLDEGRVDPRGLAACAVPVLWLMSLHR